MCIWGRGSGRVRHFAGNRGSDRVGSGQVGSGQCFAGSGRVGSGLRKLTRGLISIKRHPTLNYPKQ